MQGKVQCKVVCMQSRVQLRTSTRLAGCLRPGGEFLDAIFSTFDGKWSPEWSDRDQWMLQKIATLPTFSARVTPRTIQKRIRDATSIFHRFRIDFGSHFGRILMVFACLLFPRQCSRCLPISCFRALCFQRLVSKGCGGDALRLQ